VAAYAASAARRLARLLLAGALLLTAAAAQDAPRLTSLTVDPTTGDEGEPFDFRATIHNPTGVILEYRWDFGDGTVVESLVDASPYRHRYRDDGAYTVTLEITLPGGGTDRSSVAVNVRNVPPVVVSVARSHDPVAGAPVTFTATVDDPGDDRLTLVWDFGDGSPPVTRRDRRDATHAYATEGAYRLTLTVSDGDGGEALHTETVLVGVGMTFEATGAIVGSHGPKDLPSLAGVPVVHDGERLRFRGDLAAAARGESAAEGPGPCLVVLSNRGMSISANLLPGLVLHLSAALPQGLAEGTYPIARESNVIPIPLFDPYEREMATPGVFFASLAEVRPPSDLPRQHAFQGTGGSLTVHRFDGVRAEITFDVRLEERLTALDAVNAPGGGLAFPPAQAAHLRGRFIHDVTRGLLERTGSINPLGGAGFGDWYLCDADGRLDVVEVDFGGDPTGMAALLGVPENRAWERALYASGDAKIEITVDRPVLRSSLSDRTVVVDVYQTTYATTGEPFMPAPGTIEFVDERTFRFVPDVDLRPGVHYELTLKGGRNGVRGADGETLDEDLTWRFSTRVELATVLPRVYQVARNAKLVPGKTTMTRVYALWPEVPGLPPESQVDRFRADVTVLADGSPIYPVRSDVLIRRYDRFTAADVAAARNSVNFFGWTPTRTGGTSRVVAVVEPRGQPQQPPVRFESAPNPVAHWTTAPSLTVAYTFLQVGSWAGGVPEADKARMHATLQLGIRFAEQNFPVVEARARYIGEVALPEPPSEPVALPNASGDTRLYYVTRTTMERTDIWAAREMDRATQGQRVDFVIGIAPADFQPGINGAMIAFDGEPWSAAPGRRRPILLFDIAPASTVAHELGHAYGLCHDGEYLHQPACARSEPDTDGFRIETGGAGGATKWLWTRGGQTMHANGDGGALRSLLDPQGVADGLQRAFITNLYYDHLFDRVAARAAARGANRRPFDPQGDAVFATAVPSSHVAVRGLVDDLGAVTIERVDRVDPPPHGAEAAGDPAGPYLAEVFDAGGRVLARQAFDAVRPVASHGPNELATAVFEVLLPAPADAHRIVIGRDGRVLAERIRDARPPEVRLEWRDGALAWRAVDADGAELAVDLAYSPDGVDWLPLATGIRAAAFPLPDDLEPGPRPTVRARASSGLDTAEATLRVDVDPRLRVLATLPRDGEAHASDAALMVFLNAPLSAAGVAGGDALALTTVAGDAVPLATSVVADGRALLALPADPLPPGAYRATLAGVRSRDGAVLGEAVTWTFTVIDGDDDAGDDADTADDGTAGDAPPVSIPDPCGGVPRDVIQALLPAGVVLTAVVEGEGCTLEGRLADAVDAARRGFELGLVRARYRPTRNAQEGDVVVIAFQDAATAGEVRLTPDGRGTRLELQVRSR